MIEVDSAGTASYHIGKLPDSRMIDAGARRGYSLTSRAKALTKEYIWERELVLAMDRDNFEEITRIAGQEVPHLRLLSDFLDSSWPQDVPDPYYGGEAGFEYVLDMLEAAIPRIIEKYQT
jgi:protein-tyrosine phosphatase